MSVSLYHYLCQVFARLVVELMKKAAKDERYGQVKPENTNLDITDSHQNKSAVHKRYASTYPPSVKLTGSPPSSQQFNEENTPKSTPTSRPNCCVCC